MKRILFLSALFFILAVQVSWGQIPQTISYQGVLTDANGKTVPDGNYSLTFKLYDVEIGGAELWSESHSVTTSKGIFNVILGSVNPLTLPFDEQYWLGIAVEGGPELTPRIQLTASAYSLNTRSGGGGGGNTLDQAYDQGGPGAGRTINADSGAVNIAGPDGLTVNGNVGIGTTAPLVGLEYQTTADAASGAFKGMIQAGATAAARGVALGVYNRGVGGEGSIQGIVESTGTAATLWINPEGGNTIINYESGNVGIGTANPGSYKLAVEGKIGAREVVVTLDSWSDFVLEKCYPLMPLREVEQYIKQNKRLPDIPSEKEVLENGVSLGEMQSKLLKKVEELTLYMIEQNKKIEKLEKENGELKNRVSSLEKAK